MSSVIRQYSLADLSNLFKITYGDFELDASSWNSTSLIGTVKKNNMFVGSTLQFAQLQDLGGGQSAGALPSASTATILRPAITAKSIYSTAVIDNQSIKAARKAGTNSGAFKELTGTAMLSLKNSFRESIARQLVGNGTGSLGVIQAVAVNAPGNYTLTITAATFIEANWMLLDLLNIGALGTSLFLVQTIDLTNRLITVVRQNGADVPNIGDPVYKQKSRNNELSGLKYVTDTAVGQPIYGITSGYRWQSSTLAAAGQTLSVKLMRQLVQQMQFLARNDEGPTDFILSYTAMRLFTDGEDAKSIIYVDPEKAPNRQAGGKVATVSIDGRLVRLHRSPYIEADRMYAIHKDKVEFHIRPDTSDGASPGGFLEAGDSGIFFPLHVSGTPLDSYQLFYATYGDLYINPVFTGVITGLATA